MFREMMEALGGDLVEAQDVFDTDLSDYSYSDTLLDNAKETLMMMNLQTLQQADKLQETTEVLESRTRELEERSRRDGLTRLYNRAYLDQKLSHEFTMANDRDWSMVVMFVDLDHFKRVNDTHGHQAGDQVLQRAASALVEGTRDDDIVARYGGEEFVIVMPGHGRKSAHIVAERLVNSFRAMGHTVNDGKVINVTVSIGLSILGEGENFSSVEDMLEAADKALYVAKKSGRNRYVIYSDDMDSNSGVTGSAMPAA
jgi:diguanylate cyclase (GGDEF)-like protein